MKKLLILTIILGFGLSTMAGCVTLGNSFPGTYASKIIIGETTRSEIESELGKPFRIGLDSGDQTATYLHYKFGLFSEAITSDLTIVYTSSGIVKSYVFNSNQYPKQQKDEL